MSQQAVEQSYHATIYLIGYTKIFVSKNLCCITGLLEQM